jgi:hypothetical protein
VQAWSSTVAYIIGDVVLHSGVVYRAIAVSLNQQPPNAAFWSTTVNVPANEDWVFAYRMPADAVLVRRIVKEESARNFDPAPELFRIGRDTAGALVFTNRRKAVIEYTARISCAVLAGDALFRDAFAWRLAASLAPSLAQVDPDAVEQHGRGPQDRPRERKVTEAQLRERAARQAWAMYFSALNTARAADAREQQQDRTGDADWIVGRE